MKTKYILIILIAGAVGFFVLKNKLIGGLKNGNGNGNGEDEDFVGPPKPKSKVGKDLLKSGITLKDVGIAGTIALVGNAIVGFFTRNQVRGTEEEMYWYNFAMEKQKALLEAGGVLTTKITSNQLRYREE